MFFPTFFVNVDRKKYNHSLNFHYSANGISWTFNSTDYYIQLMQLHVLPYIRGGAQVWGLSRELMN